MLKKILIIIFLVTTLSSCKKETPPTILKTGVWRGNLKIQGQDLPFNFEVNKDRDRFEIDLINGDERLSIDKVYLFGDSLAFNLHIFDIEIRAKIKNDSLIGTYTKNYAEGYVLPFYAVHGKNGRFDNMKAHHRFDGKWETYFMNADGKKTLSIGVFQSKDSVLTGTFLNTTGDYRYLDGYTSLDTMYLYSFDGNHLYKFKGVLENESIINGTFWSGKTGYKNFVSKRNDSIELPDPHSLTYLKEGYDKVSFSFKNVDGKEVSIDDPAFKNKVVVLQILGTWCPNCMDETRFLADWYKKNKDRGVEIIGLAYEIKPEFTYAKDRIKTMKTQMRVDYEVLVAGLSTTKSASESLPMLNEVISFPTTIIIDKFGKVRQIHTGFSGPATGEYYDQYVKDFNQLMDELLEETI
ncbi:peroxiredoxin family protein [Namhaeicola litoreus]|uniref:Peroxiredoxin family protein n=1 Tax=Namhaeicola litoreus TaxID=1052145 RepID=A0ABW3Y1H6_9FLAO